VSKVTLELTHHEAETLGRLLYCHIAGPDSGPRGVLSGICYKIPIPTWRYSPIKMRSGHNALDLAPDSDD
jgi:hypothetical protein